MVRCSRSLTMYAGESFEDAVLRHLCHGGGRGVVRHREALLTGRINYPEVLLCEMSHVTCTHPSADSPDAPPGQT